MYTIKNFVFVNQYCIILYTIYIKKGAKQNIENDMIKPILLINRKKFL